MQLVNLNKLYPKKYGVLDPSLLKSDETVIYDSDTLVETMEYAGPINTIIHHASGLSSYMKQELVGIRFGYCSLGGQWNNANFYGPNTRSLSGVDRICYVRGINPDKEDKMKVMEYYGSRGSKFSAYYLILLKKIRQSSKFKVDKDGSFIVDKSNVVAFVDVVNNLMDDILNSRLVMLKVPNQYDKIKIEGSYYYYNVVIWDYADQNRPLEKELEESMDLKHNLEMVVKYIMTRDSINVDGVEINVRAIGENNLRLQGISMKDKIVELSEYIKELSEETGKFEDLMDSPVSDIYEGLTEKILDNILTQCDGIKENIDILESYAEAKISTAIDRIEDIINSEELRDLAEFNYQSYAERIFRKIEEEHGFDEDKSDDRMDSASSSATYKGEELYYSAEKLLQELKDKLNEICM
ncbi:hypothetical protein [Clostridium hydrogenum]|uniref:hypothetical protein n=1 Tax=Clostridium hydrogenum TaxID=2855764 RepID=UPI001F173A8C|nr:hypothetical protein [Clostridium hydrogenum]